MFQSSAAAVFALACTVVVAVWTARILFRH
jgi:hypothetical protein